MKLEASALPAVTLAGQDVSCRDVVRGKDVHKCKLSIFGADDFVTSEGMLKPQRRAACSANAAVADGVLKLADRLAQRSARGKAVEHIMLDNFAARRVRLPLHCGRHAATARRLLGPRLAQCGSEAPSIVLTSSSNGCREGTPALFPM